MAPFSVTPASIVVSSPISTPASITAVAGLRKVTPLRACPSTIRACATSSIRIRSARSFTPAALETSSVRKAATESSSGKTSVR